MRAWVPPEYAGPNRRSPLVPTKFLSFMIFDCARSAAAACMLLRVLNRIANAYQKTGRKETDMNGKTRVPVPTALVSTLTSLLAASCLSSAAPAEKAPDPAATDGVTPSRTPIAVVLGETIYDDQRDDFQSVLWNKLRDAYVAEHELAASPAEIDAFLARTLALAQDQIAIGQERRKELTRELQSPHITEEGKRKATEELARLQERDEQEQKELEALKHGEYKQTVVAMGKYMIEKWRFDQALYARYKGRVIWQQFGLEPIEAWEKFLHEQEARKCFELYEPDLLDALHDYFDMSHADVPQEAADLYYAHEKPVCFWTEEEINNLQQQTSAALYGTPSRPARQETERAEVTPSDSTGPQPLKTMTNTIGMELVWIPPGEFAMGSDGGEADEKPVHTVRISQGFWMSRTEVTQAQYRTIMDARPWYGQLQVRNSGDDPAVYVTWDDADEFCRTLGRREDRTYRLPTEAEWEYACRAGTVTTFSFGDSDSALAEHAWFEKNVWLVGLERAQPVRGKRPNAFGLYDMHGNVWEWCHDWYDPHDYASGPSTDPAGPATGAKRVIRGGSWFNYPHYLRVTFRDDQHPIDTDDQIGFRCARSP